jgi:hypothetical protein
VNILTMSEYLICVPMSMQAMTKKKSKSKGSKPDQEYDSKKANILLRDSWNSESSTSWKHDSKKIYYIHNIFQLCAKLISITIASQRC